ncbi:MAG TPA: right-handed parallel beta-helix repeat-containing protein [Saprospiraceae bacterium]|nr:right-handed parallel beta-helix repeat-containing protein [Saprospiraceae bacterium]
MRTLFFCFGLLLFGSAFWSCDKTESPQPLPAIYGADANPTGDSIGGGNGYSKIVTVGDFVVNNVTELLAAFNAAQPGNVILVAPGASIDISGLINVQIPEGITLAGNRGQNGAAGPLIFSTSTPAESVVFFVEKNVRITGLRFRGPDDNYPDIDYAVRPDLKLTCFAVQGENIEVENCEISNFSRGGVEVYPNGKNIRVHHCYLHDIHSYPVVALNNSQPPVIIEANRIHWIWHATAGSGAPGTGYEARYNIIVREAAPDSWQPYVGQHAIDMHDYLPVLQERGYHIAGDYMHIHHNTFVNHAGSDPSVLTSYDAAVRGVPRVLAEFDHNIFLQSDPAQAIFHLNGNTWVYDNLYGPQQTLIPIALQTTPQILFVYPPPPDHDIPLLGGNLALDIKINLLDTLSLRNVLITLNGDTIYEKPKAPAQGEVMINTSTLDPSLPFQALTVKATDSRNVTGEHTTVFRVE